MPAVAQTVATSGRFARPQPRSLRTDRALIRGALAGLGGRSRGAVPPPLAAGLPRRVPDRPRPRRGRGHRPGGVRGRDPPARPVRPTASVRAVARRDRRQPRDRLGAGPDRAARDRRRRRRTRPHRPSSQLGRYSQEVLAALAALSPEHRAVIVLRYLLEYTPGRDRPRARTAARDGQLTAAAGSRRARDTAAGGGAA